MPTLNNRRTDWECNICGAEFVLYVDALAHEGTHRETRHFNWYLCCIVNGKLDAITFPNPAADSSAINHAHRRADELRARGKHCYVAEIKEILPPKEDL